MLDFFFKEKQMNFMFFGLNVFWDRHLPSLELSITTEYFVFPGGLKELVKFFLFFVRRGWKVLSVPKILFVVLTSL